MRDILLASQLKCSIDFLLIGVALHDKEIEERKQKYLYKYILSKIQQKHSYQLQIFFLKLITWSQLVFKTIILYYPFCIFSTSASTSAGLGAFSEVVTHIFNPEQFVPFLSWVE